MHIVFGEMPEFVPFDSRLGNDLIDHYLVSWEQSANTSPIRLSCLDTTFVPRQCF